LSGFQHQKWELTNKIVDSTYSTREKIGLKQHKLRFKHTHVNLTNRSGDSTAKPAALCIKKRIQLHKKCGIRPTNLFSHHGDITVRPRVYDGPPSKGKLPVLSILKPSSYSMRFFETHDDLTRCTWRFWKIYLWSLDVISWD
jgi:hypothetical protein